MAGGKEVQSAIFPGVFSKVVLLEWLEGKPMDTYGPLTLWGSARDQPAALPWPLRHRVKRDAS